VKSAILDKGENYYTHMGKIFLGIENEHLKYNWLITDCVCYPQDEKLYEMFLKDYVWISGERLTEIILKEDFQFIWGVFSGFSKDVNLEEILNYDLPLADGYAGFWEDNVGIQHPLVDIEIVAWDSTLTLFISKNDKLTDLFMKSFPLAEDLSVKNSRDNSEIAHIEELMIQELAKRKIEVNEKILDKKYLIWKELYSKRKTFVKDEQILRCIRKKIILIKMEKFVGKIN
jgi:hypothetical protein